MLPLISTLDVFKHDPEFEANEEKYRAVKIEIIGDDSGEADGADEEDEESSEESGSEEETKGTKPNTHFKVA